MRLPAVIEFHMSSLTKSNLSGLYFFAHLADRSRAHEGGGRAGWSSAHAVVRPHHGAAARVAAGGRHGHALPTCHCVVGVAVGVGRRLRVGQPPGARSRRAALLVVCGSCKCNCHGSLLPFNSSAKGPYNITSVADLPNLRYVYPYSVTYIQGYSSGQAPWVGLTFISISPCLPCQYCQFSTCPSQIGQTVVYTAKCKSAQPSV